MSAGAGGVVFGIVGSFDRVGFSRVPLAPACGKNVTPHLGVEKNNLGVSSPRPSEPDVCNPGSGGQRAVVEDKATVRGRRMLRLGG